LRVSATPKPSAKFERTSKGYLPNSKAKSS